MAKLPCITCGQSIPEGQEYPFFIGQYRLNSDLTKADEAAYEVFFLLEYLKAISEVIPAASDVSDETLNALAHLVRDLVKEVERRMEWLHDAGKAMTADRKEG